MKQAKVRLKGRDRLSLFTDLHTMLKAGIPLLDTIESLEPDAKGGLKKILAELHRSLINGDTLSKAMAKFPAAFDPVTINLMRAAESGGTLEETLEDLVASIKKEIAFSSSIKTAMIYPAFVMVLFTGIILLLLTFVVPRITQAFTNARAKIPATTRALMNASEFFLDHWPLVILGVVALVIITAVLFNRNKRVFVQALLRLPMLKRLGTNIDLMHLTRSLSLLLKAGVPLDETLLLTKHTIQKKQVIAIVDQMQRNLNVGKPLATNLRNTKGVIPVMMARSMETAETSGTLEPTMQSLAEHFDNQVSENLKSLSSLLEPIMILVVGLLVGGLMLTVIAPMYNMVSQQKAMGSKVQQ